MEGAGGIGGMLARSSGYSGGNWSTHYFYHADGNGNITYLVDASQALAASYRYDAFGNTLSSSGSQASANVYRFSSKEANADSGMYYFLYRFYDPNLQRWLNRDPIAETGFRISIRRIPLVLEDVNLFEFARNSPTRYLDPFGLGLLPNTSALNCFNNCLHDRKISPGLGRAIAKHTLGHAFGIVGTGVCGVLAVGESFGNILADLGTVGFGAFETYEVVETAEDSTRLRDDARKAFAVCLMNCARQWHDFDGAYDFWEIYK